MFVNHVKETSVGLLLLVCDLYWLLVGNATSEYLIIVMLLNMSIKFAIFQENEEQTVDWIMETAEYLDFSLKRGKMKQRILVMILSSSICYLRVSAMLKVGWFFALFYAKRVLGRFTDNGLLRLALDFLGCLGPAVMIRNEPTTLILMMLALKTISSHRLLLKLALLISLIYILCLGKVTLVELLCICVWFCADMCLSVNESQSLMLFSVVLVSSIAPQSMLDFANYLLIYAIFYVAFVFDMRSSLDYYISFFAKFAYCVAILCTMRAPPLMHSIERQLAYITVSLFIKESKIYFAYFLRLTLIEDPAVSISLIKISNFFKFILSLTLSIFYYSKYHLFAKIKVKIFSLPFWQLKVKSFDTFSEWIGYSKLGIVFTFLQIILFAITLLTMNERDYKIVREISVV